MDNLSSHKTQKLMNYYRDKKINVVFNSPYISIFNAVELIFRHIKRILYINLFNNIEEVEKKVDNILRESKLNETLL